MFYMGNIIYLDVLALSNIIAGSCLPSHPAVADGSGLLHFSPIRHHLDRLLGEHISVYNVLNL